MKTPSYENFQEELRQTGSYHTKTDDCPVKRAKPSWLTTLRYTWGVMRVFPWTAFYKQIGILTTRRWAKACYSTVWMPEKLGMNVSIEGFENLRDLKEPAVILSNHMSTTETILFPPIFLAFRPFSYVAKASLAKLPLLARAAVQMRMVPIGRVSPREDLINILNEGTKRLHDGDNFLIFPQGTRMEVFSHKKFSSIGAKLAERAGVPIVPIVVDTRCQPTRKTGFLKRFFKDMGSVDPSKDIRVCCGPAIPLGKSKDMHEKCFDWMATKLEEWGLPTER